MKHRDTILITGGLALAGALVWMLTSIGGTQAVASGVPGLEPEPVGSAVPLDPAEAVAQTAVMTAPIVPVTERRMDTSGMTSGLIQGDVALDPEVVQRIQSITVLVQELATTDPDAQPFSHSEKVIYERRTPTFAIHGIPFSNNGYSVRVFSPGLNGSEQIVAVTEMSPIADALLQLSPPVPFTVRLRNQDRYNVINTKVIMRPVDQPLGRPWLNGETDNFGSLLFEEVLAGDYLIFIGDINNPVVPAVRVTVRPPGLTIQPEPAFVGNQSVKHQLTWITVPEGKALIVSVTGPAGYGLRGAKLTILATTSMRYQPYEGVTDYNGRYVFPHLPAGRYELTAVLEKHQRWTRNVRWTEDEDPPQVEVRLIPLRNF